MAIFQVLLICVALLLAYANGANDNFKGVATLYGGGSLSYSKALSVATVATLLSSLASLYLAAGLLKSFHGVALVPAALVGNAGFVLATGSAPRSPSCSQRSWGCRFRRPMLCWAQCSARRSPPAPFRDGMRLTIVS